MNSYSENLQKARDALGSYDAIGDACGVSGKAVIKWRNKGVPPRTEYSGETQYAKMISDACRKKGIDLSETMFLPERQAFSQLRQSVAA